jgi:hypothetical protein
MGYLTEGYFGVIFLWGIFIRGGYLQTDSQVFVGTFQVIQTRNLVFKKKTNLFFYFSYILLSFH